MTAPGARRRRRLRRHLGRPPGGPARPRRRRARRRLRRGRRARERPTAAAAHGSTPTPTTAQMLETLRARRGPRLHAARPARAGGRGLHRARRPRGAREAGGAHPGRGPAVARRQPREPRREGGGLLPEPLQPGVAGGVPADPRGVARRRPRRFRDVAWHRTPEYYARGPWRGQRRRSGGGRADEPGDPHPGPRPVVPRPGRPRRAARSARSRSATTSMSRTPRSWCMDHESRFAQRAVRDRWPTPWTRRSRSRSTPSTPG